MESAKYTQNIMVSSITFRSSSQININIVGPILLFRKNINTKNTQQIETTTNAVLDLSKNCLLFSIKGVHGLSKISFWYQCLTSTYIWKQLVLT